MSEYLRCIQHGEMAAVELDHPDCPVILKASTAKGFITEVCKCECRTCKRAWFAKGRPLLLKGRLVTDGTEKR